MNIDRSPSSASPIGIPYPTMDSPSSPAPRQHRVKDSPRSSSIIITDIAAGALPRQQNASDPCKTPRSSIIACASPHSKYVYTSSSCDSQPSNTLHTLLISIGKDFESEVFSQPDLKVKLTALWKLFQEEPDTMLKTWTYFSEHQQVEALEVITSEIILRNVSEVTSEESKSKFYEYLLYLSDKTDLESGILGYCEESGFNGTTDTNRAKQIYNSISDSVWGSYFRAITETPIKTEHGFDINAKSLLLLYSAAKRGHLLSLIHLSEILFFQKEGGKINILGTALSKSEQDEIFEILSLPISDSLSKPLVYGLTRAEYFHYRMHYLNATDPKTKEDALNALKALAKLNDFLPSLDNLSDKSPVKEKITTLQINEPTSIIISPPPSQRPLDVTPEKRPTIEELVNKTVDFTSDFTSTLLDLTQRVSTLTKIIDSAPNKTRLLSAPQSPIPSESMPVSQQQKAPTPPPIPPPPMSSFDAAKNALLTDLKFREKTQTPPSTYSPPTSFKNSQKELLHELMAWHQPQALGVTTTAQTPQAWDEKERRLEALREPRPDNPPSEQGDQKEAPIAPVKIVSKKTLPVTKSVISDSSDIKEKSPLEQFIDYREALRKRKENRWSFSKHSLERFSLDEMLQFYPTASPAIRKQCRQWLRTLFAEFPDQIFYSYCADIRKKSAKEKLHRFVLREFFEWFPLNFTEDMDRMKGYLEFQPSFKYTLQDIRKITVSPNIFYCKLHDTSAESFKEKISCDDLKRIERLSKEGNEWACTRLAYLIARHKIAAMKQNTIYLAGSKAENETSEKILSQNPLTLLKVPVKRGCTLAKGLNMILTAQYDSFNELSKLNPLLSLWGPGKPRFKLKSSKELTDFHKAQAERLKSIQKHAQEDCIIS